jgi:hypothetical protein
MRSKVQASIHSNRAHAVVGDDSLEWFVVVLARVQLAHADHVSYPARQVSVKLPRDLDRLPSGDCTQPSSSFFA